MLEEMAIAVTLLDTALYVESCGTQPGTEKLVVPRPSSPLVHACARSALSVRSSESEVEVLQRTRQRKRVSAKKSSNHSLEVFRHSRRSVRRTSRSAGSSASVGVASKRTAAPSTGC